MQEKTMTEVDKNDIKLLNKYLYQYKNCLQKKSVLENRRSKIIQELSLSSIPPALYLFGKLSDNFVAKHPNKDEQCAALAVRIEEINKMIDNQISNATATLIDIMSVIDFLPGSSTERSILEHKYIDCLTWNKIAELEYMTRTPVIKYWRQGLEKLLKFSKVRKIVRDFEHQNLNAFWK